MECLSCLATLINEGLNITTKWQPRETNDFSSSSLLSLLMNKCVWDEREEKKTERSHYFHSINLKIDLEKYFCFSRFLSLYIYIHIMSNEDDECDSSSLFAVASHSDVNSFLHAQAAKITAVGTSITDDEDDSMDGSLVARFTQIPSEKKFVINPSTSRNKPYLSRSCFAALTCSSPIKSSSSQKISPSDDLTELKWLNTFKIKELKDDFNSHETKEKDNGEKTSSSTQQQQEQNTNTNNNPNNDEDRLAKLISELKSYDHESKKITTTSFGLLLFLALYSTRDEKHLAWSLTIKQLYEYAQLNAKQITSKRGWKNALRQALTTIPCFVKTKRDLLKSRSLWTIDSYYRPLLTKAYLTIPPIPSPSANK